MFLLKLSELDERLTKEIDLARKPIKGDSKTCKKKSSQNGLTESPPNQLQ